MNTVQHDPLPRFHHLSVLSSREGMIAFGMQDGIPVLRASDSFQQRIEVLLHKQQETALSDSEREEFESYEEMDDYLSLLNRITRNLFLEGEFPVYYGIPTQKREQLATADS